VLLELKAQTRDAVAEILDLIAHGMSNVDIASRLYLSAKTVRNHISNIFLKLQYPIVPRP
jgi:DNA-binding NarL/FixJ family response regulator